MRFNRLVTPQPISQDAELEKAALKAVVSGSNDFYGASSIEHFSSASGLTYTHEDAQGFLDYPTSFSGKGANFWLKDAGVKVWEYEEAYDNWQDTYGMDSVMVFYHSGHGNMDSNGIFQAPLGAKWDNRDWVFSNNMACDQRLVSMAMDRHPADACFCLLHQGPQETQRADPG
jgi:hypothetical protein